MRMDKMTTRFQQAIAEAQSRALGLDNQFFEPAHLLIALLEQDNSTVKHVLAKSGVDRKQFIDTYNSFGVRTKMQRASQLAAAYKIDGVPTLAVAGKFITSPSMTGSNGAALKMVDTLVDRVRKGG